MTNVLITGNLSILGDHNLVANLECAVLKEIQPNLTGGGASVAAGYNDRILNTLIDPFNLITLDSGNVLFSFNSTGSYLIRGQAPSHLTGLSQAFLADSSNTIVMIGTSELTPNGGSVGTSTSTIDGILEVTSTSDQYKIHHYTTSAVTAVSQGLGVSTNCGTSEVYSQLAIIKIL